VRDELEKMVRELVEQVRAANGEIPAPAKPRRRLFGFGKS
jgi:Tfp pilus assembly protein FimV